MSVIDLEKAFQEKIDKEIKIEPKDWMPEAYRKTNLRQISQHAHSEIVEAGLPPKKPPTMQRNLHQNFEYIFS